MNSNQMIFQKRKKTSWWDLYSKRFSELRNVSFPCKVRKGHVTCETKCIVLCIQYNYKWGESDEFYCIDYTVV